MEQFIVSARKYRPQTFKDVVGQETITNTLVNAIDHNHLAQALLFTGPRGVGKTTCARILARKINQEGYDDPNEDFAFNVFELDAASNNSVDDIRNLIDQVRIPPQTGKYKVYIIDEVHMLSTSAFNAFLKTLEEPPKHAIFILATTEKHKIIPTILSRCQIFDFKRITIADAKNHLAEVAQNQNITFEEDALHIIAQKADGAMRDALSIFDRVVSYCGNHLTRQAVAENLNVLDFDYYLKITDMIIKNDIPQLLIAYHDILSKGFDGHHFIIGLASHFRNLMVCKNPDTLKLLEVSEENKRLFFEQAQNLAQDVLIEAIEIANECDLKYKVSQNQRLLVELCLMQLASLTHSAEKKKAKRYLIPPAYFKNNSLNNLPVEVENQPNHEIKKQETAVKEKIAESEEELVTQKITVNKTGNEHTISALSLKSIKLKKELEASLSKVNVNPEDLPKDTFTYEELMTQWDYFADKFHKTGRMLMSSIMRMGTPMLAGDSITLELPNEGSKISFDENKYDLVNALRKKLNNYALEIHIVVNEEIKIRKAFTIEDKYNLLLEKNPALDVLRKTFDLDLKI